MKNNESSIEKYLQDISRNVMKSGYKLDDLIGDKRYDTLSIDMKREIFRTVSDALNIETFDDLSRNEKRFIMSDMMKTLQDKPIRNLEKISFELKQKNVNIDRITNMSAYRKLNYESRCWVNKCIRTINKLRTNNNLNLYEKNELIYNQVDKLKNDLDKFEEILKESFEKISSTNSSLMSQPFSKGLINNSNFIHNQKTEEWPFDAQVQNIVNTLLIKNGMKKDQILISVLPNKADIKRYQDDLYAFNLDFKTPLQEFKRKGDTNDKFSRIVNVNGNHWVSLTIVPDELNKSANIIYRDSFGSEIPQQLLDNIKEVYGDVKLAYNKTQLQSDKYSCGPFACLAALGDRLLPNRVIKHAFKQLENDDVINYLNDKIKIVEREPNYFNRTRTDEMHLTKRASLTGLHMSIATLLQKNLASTFKNNCKLKSL